MNPEPSWVARWQNIGLFAIFILSPSPILFVRGMAAAI
jgi:hypothetical protein